MERGRWSPSQRQITSFLPYWGQFKTNFVHALLRQSLNLPRLGFNMWPPSTDLLSFTLWNKPNIPFKQCVLMSANWPSLTALRREILSTSSARSEDARRFKRLQVYYRLMLSTRIGTSNGQSELTVDENQWNSRWSGLRSFVGMTRLKINNAHHSFLVLSPVISDTGMV